MKSLPDNKKHKKINKQIYVVFRFDDYSSLSSTDIELKIIRAFHERGISLTFSVIPYICSDNVEHYSKNAIAFNQMKADILRAAIKDGTLDIALHGYSHQTIDSNQITEFKGLDYNHQFEKLAKGKNFLEGITDASVNTFVPPWNTYDLNTLVALEKLGFLTISAKKDGDAKKDFKLNFLPATSNLLKLKDAIKAGRISSDSEPIIVVVFHNYDFKEINENMGYVTYQDFCALLNWIGQQQDVRLLSINQATKVIKELNAKRFLLNKKYNMLSKLLIPSLRGIESHLYFKHPSFVKKLVIISGFYLIVLSIGVIVSSMIWF